MTWPSLALSMEETLLFMLPKFWEQEQGVSPYSSNCKGHVPGRTREGDFKKTGENTEEQSASPEESPLGPSTGVRGTAKGSLCNATPQTFLQPAVLPTATLESIPKIKIALNHKRTLGV